MSKTDREAMQNGTRKRKASITSPDRGEGNMQRRKVAVEVDQSPKDKP
jgi:hypothetical protein